MRWPLIQLPPFVLLNCITAVDIQILVRIYRNNYFANECVDPSLFKPKQYKTKAIEKGNEKLEKVKRQTINII